MLDNIGLVVIKIRLRLTRHDLYGIYAEGIGIYLSNGINNVPGLVETLEPAPRERIYRTTGIEYPTRKSWRLCLPLR